MSRVFLSGRGAVSPAGWGAEHLCTAMEAAALPATQSLERPGWVRPLTVRRVPPAQPRPPWMSHPRLRRAPLISQFVVGAALEALGDPAPGADSLGIVYCTTCGCVSYSRRFYDEVLHDPAVASPVLFPETVFNSPASHLATVIGSTAINYTLVGDSGVFLHGLVLGAGWLAAGRVERVLVVAAEEVDWIVADVLRHFRKSMILSEGAGAILLTREPESATCAELEWVTDPVAHEANRSAAGKRARAALPADGCGVSMDSLGEAMSAGAAWQVIAALDRARRQAQARAQVVVEGVYQEAIAAGFRLLSPPKI